VQRYDCHLLSYDGGQPPRSASLHVAIVVGDVNDHSPRFDGDLFTVTVPEDFPLGVPFLQVICTWSLQLSDSRSLIIIILTGFGASF